jgi:hypothetical protein
MNTTLHIVTEIMGEPYTMYGKWFVRVLADSYGRVSEDIMMFDSEKAAKGVFGGYRYDA